MEDGRTKIVCTIGPASASLNTLTRMIESGMDVARLNFSHGTHDEHSALIKMIRAAAKKANKIVTILQDLQGPKIRVGTLPVGGLDLHEGQTVTLVSAKGSDVLKDGVIPITFPGFHKLANKGDRLLLDDGRLELEVLRVKGKLVTAVVQVGGVLFSKKGINFPDSVAQPDAFTEKDEADLLFGLAQGVDFVCLSFVTSAQEIETLRRLVIKESRALKQRPPLIMAKIERKAALLNVDEIIAAADAVMLGRGDLGIEISLAEVPVVQKELAERCRLFGKPFIVAIHMLESMRENPRATRAEISDVANAVFDQVDAVMLSAESATGRYPVVTVKAMAQVIKEAEDSRFDQLTHEPQLVNCLPSAFGQAVALMADKGLIDGVMISASLRSVIGNVTMFRPHVPIFALALQSAEARQINLYYSVRPILFPAESQLTAVTARALIRKYTPFLKGKKLAYLAVREGGGTCLEVFSV